MASGEPARLDDLDAVAQIALDEGIPLKPDPAASIVERLMQAANYEERMDLLDAHRDDILADCDAALADVHHQWAQECRDAIRAVRVDLDGPAQSHAAGIIDSIVLCALGPKTGGSWPSSVLSRTGNTSPFGGWRMLALRPPIGRWSCGFQVRVRLLRTTSTSLTAHAIGRPGLSERSHALIAVTLAASRHDALLGRPSERGGLAIG